LTDPTGKPLSGPTEVTFKLYKQEADEDALWTETQSVEVDKKGRYTVLLGATQAEGLPVELFSSAEAHWLGVEVQGKPQQSRTLLVSVPYALKAVDAEKLAGKSVSDFVLTESLGEQVRQVIQAQGQVVAEPTLAGTTLQKQTAASSTATPQVSSPGPKFPPSTFSGTTSDQIVLVQQNGSGAGLVALTPQNNAVAGLSTNGTGVFGQSSGSGVAGIATAATGFTSGVFGQAASVNGTGVFGTSVNWVGVGGQATATSGGPAYGVWGDSVSTGGAGVAGFEDATSGFTNGVFGQSASTSGTGVFGVATATSGSATGVVGQTASPNGNGVTGVATATSGSPTGVFGVISSPNGAGVGGVATATTGFNNGVFGGTFSNEGAGVSGGASSTSGNPVGVVGTSTGAGGGIGAWGIFQATSGFGVGVRGDLEEPTASGAAGLFLTFSPNSVAGQFANASRQGLILQGLSGPFDATQKEVFSVDANGNLQISGNLTVSGTKSSTAKLQDGREVALYAVESPENWFEDFGSAELNNGVAWVPLDASFAQAVNAAVNYHVFLTANGDSNGLYVARKTAAGFEIREHGGGTSNVAFDYRIVARRRGYEAIRMLQVPERKILETMRPPLKMAISRPNVERVKITPSIPPAAIRPVPPRLVVPAQAIRPVPQVPKMNVPQPPKPR
jgi:hypothetical protein